MTPLDGCVMRSGMGFLSDRSDLSAASCLFNPEVNSVNSLARAGQFEPPRWGVGQPGPSLLYH